MDIFCPLSRLQKRVPPRLCVNNTYRQTLGARPTQPISHNKKFNNMRQLSSSERETIKHLVEKPTTLENLLGNINDDLVFRINKPQKEVVLLRVKPEIGKTTDIANDFASFWLQRLLFISTLIKLLHYLEQNGYIISHLLTYEYNEPYYLGKLREHFNRSEVSLNDNTYKYDDEFLIEFITKYCFRIIYPTEELKIYVRNKFRTPEEIRFSKTYHLAIYAIIISIIIGIGGLLIAIFDSKDSIQLDEYQYKEFTNRLDKIYLNMKTIAIESDTSSAKINKQKRPYNQQAGICNWRSAPREHSD
jgi:hypothetical protein